MKKVQIGEYKGNKYEDGDDWEKSSGPKILCPYCSEPYDSKMLTAFDYGMGSEQTGIYGETTKVKIYCSNCKKLVYQKD